MRRLALTSAAFVLALVVLDLAGFGAPPAAAVVAAALGDCEVADALAEAGQAEAATRAYVQVLRQDPASPCARTGLAALELRATLRGPADDDINLGGDDVDLPDLARFDHWIAEAGRRQR